MVMVLAPEVLCPRRDSTNQEVREGKGEDRKGDRKEEPGTKERRLAGPGRGLEVIGRQKIAQVKIKPPKALKGG